MALILFLASCVSDMESEAPVYRYSGNADKPMSETEYVRLQALPSDSLLRLGDAYSRLYSEPDSAMIAYALITKQYRRDLPIEQKRNIIDAYKKLWFNFFYHYYDYVSANDALRKAIELSEECGEPMGRLYLNMGIFYSEMFEVTGELSLGEDAIRYQKLAFREAAKEKDYDVMVSAVDNLLCNSATLGDMAKSEPEMTRLREMATDRQCGLSEMWRYKYVVLLDEGFQAVEREDYNSALDSFRRQFDTFPPISSSMARYYIYSHFKAGNLLIKIGLRDEAAKQLEMAYSISVKYGVKDYLILIYDLLSDLYADNGDREKAIDYKSRYLNLKDSLLSYRQLASAKEMSVYMDMRDIDREISLMKKRDEFQRNLIVIVTLIALMVTGVLIFNYVKNRKIRRLNITLYEKNVELLKTVSSRQRDVGSVNAIDSVGPHEKTPEADHMDEEDSRYRNSALGACQKEEIMRKVLEVMESDEIYKPGFTSESLSRLTGENYKYISQVINEFKGCNFNVFLNEYRIRRACFLIDSPDSGGFTIEWLANQVGFKSRNTFTLAFKKVTGLNPSEYIKIAKSGGNRS